MVSLFQEKKPFLPSKETWKGLKKCQEGLKKALQVIFSAPERKTTMKIKGLPNSMADFGKAEGFIEKRLSFSEQAEESVLVFCEQSPPP